ncbi:MAG: translocation and assembly module TamB, partial [Gammaproteobacteria bacterium]
ELDFTLTSLEPIARLSGQQLSGHGRGHAQFAARGGGESRVQAEFNALHINEFSVQRLQVNGTASDLASDRDGATPRLALHIDAAAVTAADNTRLQHVSLHADGPLGALSVNAKLAGSHRERALAATLRAIATLDQPRKTVRVNALQANYGDEVLQLLQPTLITTSARSVHIDNLDLSIADQGRLRGWFKQEPAAASMNLELASIPLHLLKVFAALPIAKGRLSGTVSGSTDRAAPALDARLSVSQLRMDNAPAATGALAAALTAAWDGHALSADLSISGPFEPAITGRFRVPMTLAKPSPAPSKGKGKGKGEDTGSSSTSTSSLPVLNLDSTIDAQLDWRGQVEPVMALLPLPDHVLTGVATIALRVAGTLNAPLPSGELTLRDGRYENLQAGTIIEDLTLNSDFSDQQRVQFSLTGHDAEQGKLRAQGVILPGQPEQLLDITAQLEHMLLVRVDAATILSSADLSIKSSAQALNVNGKVVIEQAEIRLLNPLPPSIVDLGEVHIAGQASAADLANRGEAVVPVRLDIGIEIPGQTFVRGRGLDSEWGGSMRISGSAAQPSVEGHIESIRGVLDLVGRTFDLRRGRIVFAGKGAIDPNLDLRLVREANGITGTVFVEGTGSKPSLRFSSNPALPADEVLPRLLFGRSKQSLSGPEAVQLAAGLAALARGDESVLDVARKALGVDVLRIESGTDGADSAGNLSVGRYATEKIYVGAKQSLDGKATSVVVEIELPKNFVVDTEVGQNADGSVGITWRRDF